ncbi:MAG: Rieske 2Fe-2S domain-containing protein, partial [Okeania sp. SIO1H5]|uniref:nitrite reductase (NAD(P)H) small subunit n=1 Tax=Okeania sp. SIO1H5 TaxID=2607777 RepID=UPI0013BCCA80
MTHAAPTQDTKIKWYPIASASRFPKNLGMAARIEGKQIAVFNFDRRGEWFACDNRCPHKGDMV